MKALKIIGIVLLVIIGTLAIFPLFLNKTIGLERTIVIDAPLDMVYNQVNLHREWVKHDAWVMADTTMTMSFEGTDGEPGSKRIWKSENSESGEIERISSIEGVEIREILRIEKMGEDSVYFLFTETDEGVKVTQGFKTDLGYFYRYFGLFLDKMLIPFFDAGLNNLKTYCETNKKIEPVFEINEERYSGNSFIGIRDTVYLAELGDVFEPAYRKIYSAFAQSGIEPGGSPHAIYYEWDEVNNLTDVAVVVPVNDTTFLPADLIRFKLDSATVLSLTYQGGYDGGEDAHKALWNYLTANGYTFAGLITEEYIKGPGNEAQSEYWLTKIRYFVNKN